MVKVILTRNSDVYLTLTQRAQIANKANADLFVSAHENSVGNKSATGYEDFTSNDCQPVTTKARKAFHEVVIPFLKAHEIANRGMKTANYSVLTKTTMPAILLENLFISNPNDLKLQTNPIFRKQVAKVYADGIRAALKVIGKPNGTVCLDAGHGGKDAGAVNGKEYEKNHVLDLVRLIKGELEAPAVTQTSNQLYRLKSGTYNTEADALNAAKRVASVGVANEKYMTVFKDGTKYRWQTGTYTSSKTAENAKEKVQLNKIASTVYVIEA